MRDVTAGAVSALASIPQTLPLGLVVFAPLGPEAMALAATAALLGAAICSAVAALAGGIPLQLSGPRAGSCFLVAGFTTALSADPLLLARPEARLGAALLLVAALAFVAGVLQILVGRLNLARIVKFVPQSVIVGFNAAVGISLIWMFLPQLLGLAPGRRITDIAAPGAWSVAAASASFVTIMVALTWKRFDRRIPALLAALLAGMLSYFLMDPAVFTARGDLRFHAVLHERLNSAGLQLAAAYLLDPARAGRLFLTAAALALVLTLESLLSLATYDAFSGAYSDPNREVTAQGTGNVATALCLGIPSAASSMRTRVSYDVGGRTRLATLCHAALMAAASFAGTALSLLPSAVLAALLVVTAFSLFDRSLIATMRAVRSSSEARRDLAALLIVVLSGVLLNPLVAVILGLICSAFYMIVDMSRGIIKHETTGGQLRSHRMRTISEARRLLERASLIRVVSLEGVLFFGTGDTIRRHAEAVAPSPSGFLIYDCRALTAIDGSGRTALASSIRRLQGAGWSIAIAGSRANLLPGLRQHVAASTRYFADVDAALEWAEDGVLGGEESPEPFASFEAAASELLKGQPDDVVASIAACARPRHLSSGDVLFAPGERGDALYILASGRIRIQARIDGGPRLATFLPGVVFGEMAFIDGEPRSAAAIAEGPSLAFALARADIDLALLAFPSRKIAFLENIARVLSARLRETNRRMAID